MMPMQQMMPLPTAAKGCTMAGEEAMKLFGELGDSMAESDALSLVGEGFYRKGARSRTVEFGKKCYEHAKTIGATQTEKRMHEILKELGAIGHPVQQMMPMQQMMPLPTAAAPEETAPAPVAAAESAVAVVAPEKKGLDFH